MSALARPGPLNRAIRRFNRNVYNPLAMTVAGLRHSPYSVVKHIGRKSGRRYEAPVVAHAVSDGFIIAQGSARKRAEVATPSFTLPTQRSPHPEPRPHADVLAARGPGGFVFRPILADGNASRWGRQAHDR